MSTNDFKDRLAMIIHGRPRIQRHYGKALVRKPTDRGYYPPKRVAKSPVCGTEVSL
jgi:hypothetical protein